MSPLSWRVLVLSRMLARGMIVSLFLPLFVL
jgi:hypothetical protein